MKTLDGKVILVTGAGRGIGAAIANCCAREGASVVVNDLAPSSANGMEDCAQEVVAGILKEGGRAILCHGSVTDIRAMEELLHRSIEEFGHVDAVVNNAGILRDAIFHKLTPADWSSVLDVHLTGCFNLSRAVAPHFRKREAGAFVHMTSTTGLLGNIGQANYAAAKAGIVALSTSIALDMARFNVRSNCVAPTAWTRLVETVPETAENAAMRAKLRALTPEKIAPLVASLCSDRAAGVSGQVFGVRGEEIFLYSRPTILRTMHRSEGWSAQDCADIVLPALAPSMPPLTQTRDIINWAPL